MEFRRTIEEIEARAKMLGLTKTNEEKGTVEENEKKSENQKNHPQNRLF